MKRVSVLVVLFLVATGYCSDDGSTETTSAPTAEPWYLLAEPADSLERIIENIPSTINLTLCFNSTDIPTEVSSETLFVVRISMSNALTLKLSSDYLEFSWDDILQGNNKTLEVVGQVIGYVRLNFKLESKTINGSFVLEEHTVLSDYLVTVVRLDNTLDRTFTLVMLVMAVLNTINMGCGLDLNVVKANILRPIGPVVGFVSQFTFMPLFSFGLAMMIIDDSLKGFGLLVMGVCPGGLASNFWTLLLDGDVNLSITMTFVSSIAAMGMMPLWLWLLAPYFLPEGSVVQVPYLDMAISLILLTVPLGFGLLIRRCKPKIAEFLSVKIIKPFSFIWIFFMFGFGFYSMSHIFVLLDWNLIGAGLSVTVAGFIFGALFAWIARLNRAQIIAVSLETAMQNANIAFVILKTTLPDPYNDIAALPPIAQILMTSCLLFVFYFIFLAYSCATKKKKNNKKSGGSIANDEDYVEAGKSLMTKEQYGMEQTKTNMKSSGLETPPPQYYGGEVTEEFSWVKSPKLIVPNSPTADRSNT